ncbi:MAG: hypothetical protein DME96_11315 [Verrucomicrobia bacterium]|nr:MAG: hypothetical protein DME96_11315 [Verrucomicrobiota bacterium]
MKRILFSIWVGSLGLALTAWGQQINNTTLDTAKAHRTTSDVRTTRPANTSAMMGAHRYTSTAPFRQRTYMTPRTSSNAVVNQNARMRAFRERNFSSNQDFRARSNVVVDRDRNVAMNRTRNFDVNRDRNTAEFRSRNGLAINRDRNFAVNRTTNFDVNRRRNVTIDNNFRSGAFRGQQYAAFRNYHTQWHDRGWWRSHFDRIVLVNGGWYYWDAGYWFPAWGYAPYAYYPYDGPIYAYNGLAPDQVIADVQAQLQRDGYYDGPIDGILGPMTQDAIAAFQADNGLEVTSTIDEPTLSTLGIS